MTTSLKFGDRFPVEFFGSLKKDVVGGLDFSKAISSGRAKILDIVDSCDISSSGKDFCRACFDVCASEFFYMPTSSTGKYHGGLVSGCNCIGGNVVHTSEVLGMSDRVLGRYESVLGVFYKELAECLRIACILHDICKYPSGELYTSREHGELGAELIRGVGCSYDWKGLIAEAVQNHMYAWKFQTVFDYIRTFDGGSLNWMFLSFMLSECDYYSFK